VVATLVPVVYMYTTTVFAHHSLPTDTYEKE
jgi:hypothetical protein